MKSKNYRQKDREAKFLRKLEKIQRIAEDEHDKHAHQILDEYQLPKDYPADLEAQAHRIHAGITDDEIARREDFRDVLTFTIDPADAQDFDDALSFKTIESQEGYAQYEVGVHIADVTHYVRPGSDLDREAYERGTSVYLVDRVIPMLPEYLSNGICSLRPNEEKLCFSVIFHIDSDANILDYHICRTVIRSDYRLNYDEAQAIIESPVATSPLDESIQTLNRLAILLRERRFDKGAIAFDKEEVRFHLDDMGNPIGIYLKKDKEANHLIEEFMLLANRTIAAHIGKGEKLESGLGMAKRFRHATPNTFVYRVHDLPDPDKLRHLAQFIQRFGYQLKTSSTRKETVSKNINKLLDQASGTPEMNLISTLTVRAMAKAVYTTNNIGHYGLAFPYYTHFTSPIRRYPDMMVHRLVERYVFDHRENANPAEYEEYCKHCTDREILAAKAERDSIKYKQCEWMQSHVGETFRGVVSGVVDWGIYVELEDSKCEGLISLHDLLPHDYYTLDQPNFCLRGERLGYTFQLGDVLDVKLVKANLEKRQLDFVLAEKEGENA